MNDRNKYENVVNLCAKESPAKDVTHLRLRAFIERETAGDRKSLRVKNNNEIHVIFIELSDRRCATWEPSNQQHLGFESRSRHQQHCGFTLISPSWGVVFGSLLRFLSSIKIHVSNITRNKDE